MTECLADFAKNVIDKFIADFKEYIVTSCGSDVPLAAAYKAGVDSLNLSSFDRANKVPTFSSIKSSLYKQRNEMKSAIEKFVSV